MPALLADKQRTNLRNELREKLLAEREATVERVALPGGFSFPFFLNYSWRPSSLDLPYPFLFAQGFEAFPFTNIIPPGGEGNSKVPYYSYENYEGGQRVGIQTSPVLVSWWALKQLELGHIGAFMQNARWLKDHSFYDTKIGRSWPVNYPWVEHGIPMKPPWVNAMAQGLTMSVYIRAYNITRDISWAEECLQGVPIFNLPCEEGGVRSDFYGKGVFYEMYPTSQKPPSHVLDGFCFALFGLYEASLLVGASENKTATDEARKRFQEGLNTLCQFFTFWDFEDIWTYYGNYGYLASNLYNTLNHLWLNILGRLSRTQSMLSHAQLWNPENWGRKTALKKALVRKNLVNLYVLVQTEAIGRRKL